MRADRCTGKCATDRPPSANCLKVLLTLTITAAGFLSPAPVAATDESAQTAEQINRGRNRACQGLKGMALQDCLSNYVGPERSGRDSVYAGERRDGKESRYERPGRPREKPGRE